MIPGPKLYPDELFSSGLTRCCKWFALPLVTVLESILKVNRQGGRFLALGPVYEAAALFGTTAEELLWSHTTFPYASAFLDSDDYARAFKEALEESGSPTVLRGVMRNAEVGVGKRRICRQCLEEDLAAYGEGYWHRSHNLPGSFYCVKHRCLLQQAHAPANGRAQSILPLQCELSDAPISWQAPGALDLSVASQALLNRPRHLGEQRRARFYASLAVDLGWMHEEGQVSQPALMQVVRRCFPTDFLQATSAEFKESRAWPVRAFNPRSCNLSPLKHLMVEAALRHGAPLPGYLNHRAKGAPRANYAALDARLSKLVAAELERVQACGERLMWEGFLRRIGGLGSYRRHKARCPQLQQLAEQVKSWNSSLLKPRSRPARPLPAERTYAPARSSVQELDDRLSKAGAVELVKVMEAKEVLRLDAFMKRIGGLTAWKFYKPNCPKLVELAERFTAWNTARVRQSRLPHRSSLDDQLSTAAQAELEIVVAAGERVTLIQFMARFGAASPWQQNSKELPRLAAVAQRFKTWNSERVKAARQPNWVEVDARLSAAARVELAKVVAAGERTTILKFMRSIGAMGRWQSDRSRCPKLVEVAQQFKAWNAARVAESRRQVANTGDEAVA